MRFIVIVISFILLGLIGCTNDKKNERALTPSKQVKFNAIFRGDFQRSGEYQTEKVKRKPEVKWKFKASNAVGYPPVITSSVVYITDYNGKLYAVDKESGEFIWKRDDGNVLAPPVIADDLIYFGSLSEPHPQSYFYALNAKTGKEKWNFSSSVPIFSSPTVVGDIVLFSNVDGYLYALDRISGKEIWHFKADSDITSTQATSEGLIYLTSYEGDIYALDLKSGKQLWKFRAEGKSLSTPAIKGDSIYFISESGNVNYVYALTRSTGKEKWKFDVNEHLGSFLAVANDYIYFSDFNGKLYALNAFSGNLSWSIKVSRKYVKPVIVEQELLFNSIEHNLYSFDRILGKELWSVDVGEELFSTPAVHDGVIYFGSESGYVYAME